MQSVGDGWQKRSAMGKVFPEFRLPHISKAIRTRIPRSGGQAILHGMRSIRTRRLNNPRGCNTRCPTKHRYAIGYDTPNHYYQHYQRGELEKKDTFSKRILTTEPKFVQKRRRQKLKEKENQGAEGAPEAVSTSENGKEEKMSLVSTSEKEES